MNNFVFPELPTPKMNIVEAELQETPLTHIWSNEQFEILKKYIHSFEESLDADHEVGIMMTNFGQSVLMQVTEIKSEWPVLLIFKGYVNGREATLIQHINQLNFLLTSVPKEPDRPKRKIGFSNEE